VSVLSGSCHCGNVRVDLETAKEPEDLPVRTCGCTFCARHRPRYTSDPQGMLRISVADDRALGRYRFGLRLADFLFCLRCGVYVAAYEPGSPGRAVVNLHVLADAARFTSAPAAMDFAAEDETARLARRAKSWTPATLEV